MTRRMLINAQSPEELRMAILNDSLLENFQFDAEDAGLTQGNIYRGRIARIEPSLNAAFIDYGLEKHGFLASGDVVADARYKQPKGRGRPQIQDVLEAGQPIVVQIKRDPEGRKGAALTTNLSLAGRYLVLTPFDSMRGVSRKVEDDGERKALRRLAAKLEIPDGCGVVVRTNARDQTQTTLGRDLAALLRLWRRIFAEATKGSSIRLLYADQDLILKALRDYLDTSVEEILVDDSAAMEKVERYLLAFMPRAKISLQLYQERVPLFARYGLETQIESIHQRSVPLPSGGSIVIDGTEALTAIDVNSGRATQKATQEDTALQTNVEAAAEVARQLRLRDIGGLVVVDFIDMRALKHRNQVERELRDAMKVDKARITISKISRNGLLEINRQRLRQSLRLRSFSECPTCGGRGRVPSPELSAQRLLRRIEARAATGLMKSVRIGLHPSAADSFQNTRRREIVGLEQEFGVRVEIFADSDLHHSEDHIEWTARSVRERAEVKAVEEAAVEASEAAVEAVEMTTARETAPVEDTAPVEETATVKDATPVKRRRRRGSRGRRRSPAKEEQPGAGGGSA